MGQPLDILKKRRQFLQVAASQRKWVTPGFVLQLNVRGAIRSATRDDQFLESPRVDLLSQKGWVTQLFVTK